MSDTSRTIDALDAFGRSPGGRSQARPDFVGLVIAFGSVLAVYTIYLLTGNVVTACVLAALPLTVALVWHWPIGLALAFLSVACFRLHEAFPALMALQLPLVFALLLITSASIHLFGRNVVAYMRPELAFVLLFGFHASTGILFAADRELAYQAWSTQFTKVLLMCMLMAWLMRVPDDCNLVASVITICGALVSSVAIYNWLNGIDLVGGRVSIGQLVKSSLADPNDLAFTLMFAVAFSLSIFFARSTGPVQRGVVAIVLLSLFWAIIATKSRGGLLGTLAVLWIYFTKRYKSIVLPLIISAVVGVALFVLADISSRSDADLEDSSQGRLTFWKAAFFMALSRPLFGVGMDNFQGMLWSYASVWDGREHVAHSIWFSVMGETGFVGFGLYVGMIVYAFRAVFGAFGYLESIEAEARTRNLALALTAGFTGTCVAGTFLSQAYSWPVFIQIAFIAALARHVDSLKSASTGKPGAAGGD